MLNQEQLAAIAAAMSILQQQQQQQQALIDQYQAELQQIQNHHPDQQPNQLNHHGYEPLSPKLRNGPTISTIPSAQQHPPPATSVPRLQLLPHIHQLSPQLAPKIVEQQQSQPSAGQTVQAVSSISGSTSTKQARPPISYSAVVAKSWFYKQLQQQRNPFLGRHQNMPSELPENNHQQQNLNMSDINNFGLSVPHSSSTSNKNVPPHGRATNLLGFMGLYVGNLSPDLTKEQLEKIFSKYGEPVKAHRLIRSPVAFIKYENTESPRAAIDDLYGVLLPELTLNQDQALKLHFDRNDAQLKANYRPTELPKEDNGECYGWRTTVCRLGKSCPKKHIPINRGIDFQMWMIKSNPSSSTTSTFSNNE